MGKVAIDQFRAQVKPKKNSKLDPFRDEILTLCGEGYSLDQVMEFLALNNVKVAKSTLHGFIKRRANGIIMNRTKLQVKSEEKKKHFKGFTQPIWADSKTKIDDLI